MIKIVVQPNLQPYFRADKDGFNSIMGLDGELIRGEREKRKGRDQRVVLRFNRGGHVYFAKIYFKFRLRKTLKHLFLFGLAKSKVKKHLWALKRLQTLGINSPKVAAYGLQTVWRIPLKEFIVTEESANMISVHDYCRSLGDDKLYFTFKKELIIQIAELLHNLHSNRIKNGDFKLSHLFIKHEAEFDRRDLTLSLIDLEGSRRIITRVLQCTGDLATLYMSSIKCMVLTKKDVLRFIRFYSGKALREALTSRQGFWLKIERKVIKKFCSALKSKHILPKSLT